MGAQNPAERGRPARVLIAGGGIAGLEALMALRDLAGDLAETTLVAPDPEFLYKPLLVEEPFTFQPAERRALEPLVAEFGGRFVQDGLKRVDAGAHEVELSSGERLGYDYLIVCVGGRTHPPFAGALTLTTAGDQLSLADVLSDEGDEVTDIAFVVPGGVSWALPIYELALMTRREAERRRREDVRCTVYTPETSPLAVFGSAASEAVAQLLHARRIEVRTGVRVHAGPDGGPVAMPGDEPLRASCVVALPEIEGPDIDGLPADEHGFMAIDEHARVVGAPDVYAAGDGTNFPIKQGGIGTQQADAAAAHIAAQAGAAAEPEPFHPVLRGKLLTGEESLAMSHDVTGGSGEGRVSLDYLWWPPHKVSGKYLAAWLAEETPHDPEPPRHSVDVEVALPREWHREPMALDPLGPPP